MLRQILEKAEGKSPSEFVEGSLLRRYGFLVLLAMFMALWIWMVLRMATPVVQDLLFLAPMATAGVLHVAGIGNFVLRPKVRRALMVLAAVMVVMMFAALLAQGRGGSSPRGPRGITTKRVSASF